MDTEPIASIAFRDPETGFFLPGNKAAIQRRTPGEHRMAALRKAALDAVSEDDMREVFRAMVREAKDGNVFAANFVADRTMGKVQPMPPGDGEDDALFLARLWQEWRNDGADDATFSVSTPEETTVEPSEALAERATVRNVEIKSNSEAETR